MALDERYFVTSDLDTYFVDKDTGLPLSGGTLTFFRDSARSTPKVVYQLSGAPPDYTYTAMPNPIVLSAVGTVQNAGGDNEVIYYFPYDAEGNLDLYFVVVRDSFGTEQLSREAWPNITAADNPTTDEFPIQNQISNAQFTQVFINVASNQTVVYAASASTNQVFAFAPNWDFVISGTGTVTVQRVAIAGNDNVVTSPPYVLDITISAGITSCLLRQRFNVNSGLWASTDTEEIFLAGTFVARNEVAGTTGIQMFYAASSGGSPIIIVDGAFDNSGYQAINGVTADALPLSTDTNTDAAGYIDIYLSFSLSSHVRVSSIQVVPTLNQAGANILQYDLNSSNREQALMGDYYIPRLNSRPSPSLLTAWDFTLNPFQFAASGNIGATAGYICDQTIALRGASGAVAYSIDSVTDGLKFVTAGNNDAFYIMQYLSADDAKKILGTPLSVNVFGYRTSASSDVTMRVYLFRAPSTSVIPTLPTSVGTVAANGVFTVTAAGWTQIPRSGLDTATAILPFVSTNDDINDADTDMSFTGWQVTDATQIGDTNYFAMVVTFGYVDASTAMTINSISLIPSAIPARPAPQSFDEVMRQCQVYYETSYDTGLFAGAVSNDGAIACMQWYVASPVTSAVVSRFLSARYTTAKRIPVTPTIYALDGTLGNVLINGWANSMLIINANAAISGNWTLANNGDTGFTFLSNQSSVATGGASTGTDSVEAIAMFHFVADARLGIV